MEKWTCSNASRYVAFVVAPVPIIGLVEVLNRGRIPGISNDLLAAVSGVLLGIAIVLLARSRRTA
ncbi:MAG: hypothetical protein ACYDA1_04655 [Vulcanimicrobiaceae bacterium]